MIALDLNPEGNVFQPYFVIKKNFLSQKDCLKIINEVRDRSDSQKLNDSYYLRPLAPGDKYRTLIKGYRQLIKFENKNLQNADKVYFTEKILQQIVKFVKTCNEEYWKLPVLNSESNAWRSSVHVMNAGDIYSAHTDVLGLHEDKFSTTNSVCNNLTFVVLLSHQKDYAGGNVCLFDNDLCLQHKFEDLQQGDMLVFPSFSWHAVTRVTRGDRYTLAGWALGKDLHLQAWWADWFENGKFGSGIDSL